MGKCRYLSKLSLLNHNIDRGDNANQGDDPPEMRRVNPLLVRWALHIGAKNRQSGISLKKN